MLIGVNPLNNPSRKTSAILGVEDTDTIPAPDGGEVGLVVGTLVGTVVGTLVGTVVGGGEAVTRFRCIEYSWFGSHVKERGFDPPESCWYPSFFISNV
jgi:uncharacterized protein YcfJ